MVVGGEVVVVVVVGDVDPEDVPESDELGVVDGDVVVVEVLGAEVVGTWAGALLEPSLAPGCSLATTTPIAMVAPVATRAAELVRRRKRALARCLVSGELSWGVELIRRVLGSTSGHASSAGYCQPELLLWIVCEDSSACRRRGIDVGESMTFRECSGDRRFGHPFTIGRGTYAKMTSDQNLSECSRR